jgi:hypothetical protein
MLWIANLLLGPSDGPPSLVSALRVLFAHPGRMRRARLPAFNFVSTLCEFKLTAQPCQTADTDALAHDHTFGTVCPIESAENLAKRAEFGRGGNSSQVGHLDAE